MTVLSAAKMLLPDQFVQKMASKANPEHLISKNLLGKHAPNPHFSAVCLCTYIVSHVFPNLKCFLTPLTHIPKSLVPSLRLGMSISLVPRPFLPPVFAYCKQSKSGG